ncbi:Cadmium, cobalt and zinc/H(+)-K(+) antiporter [Actinomyces bovis]|uniref:Cadmium, cobalt and zinc/H(+)-K(+) antiporter n=1 Tax=Actinomyces bovis TaxID=1658 RepID=A0ABY1VMC5_9ACTO|nr:cation diffusion facilitator family transporter [Actinomyces bovis]SPT53079.1 Cadmium, cobalt and zinc/H(+)-K(+) antiporter [Actinomyces bovis]VEG52963.1 Cadmium, cobalt and zinc/H(+)-K(+) antiporter [Actinomyces israelii]
MSHSHHHGAAAPTSRLAIALGLTSLVLLGEVVVGLLTGSLALLADAGHMATDSIGLVVALLAAHLSTRPATDTCTWGLRRAEVIGAALQASALVLVGISVSVHAVMHLFSPPELRPAGVLAMGVVGLAANMASLAVLAGKREENLNLRAAFLEVLGDALGSVAVIGAAITTALTGWQRADAVASLLIAALIVPRAVVLLRAAGAVLLDLSPAGLDLGQVRQHLLGLDDVLSVHDLHAWSVSTDLPVLTAHVVISEEAATQGSGEEVLDALQNCVAEHFPLKVRHTTFQLEPPFHQTHEAALCS